MSVCVHVDVCSDHVCLGMCELVCACVCSGTHHNTCPYMLACMDIYFYPYVPSGRDIPMHISLGLNIWIHMSG